jgi:hypothetical protein
MPSPRQAEPLTVQGGWRTLRGDSHRASDGEAALDRLRAVWPQPKGGDMYLTEQPSDRTLPERDRPAITAAQLESGERIFADWKSENWSEMYQDGGLGDVHALLARLATVFS